MRRRARIRSFAPIANRNARILILGSMPGKESLRKGQYYAFKQNAFWRIIIELLQLDASTTYRGRIRALKSSRIAVWDVLESCVREGSSDTTIESEVANDFRKFFRDHRRIAQVFFNGAMAQTSFRRHVLAHLDASVQYARLPSTSPANATLSFKRKLEAWRVILGTVRTQRSRK